MISITTESPNMTHHQKKIQSLIDRDILKIGYHYRFKYDNEYLPIKLTEDNKWSYFDRKRNKNVEENAISTLVKEANMMYGIPEEKAGRNGWKNVYMLNDNDELVILNNIPGVEENRGKITHKTKEEKKEEEKNEIMVEIDSIFKSLRQQNEVQLYTQNRLKNLKDRVLSL